MSQTYTVEVANGGMRTVTVPDDCSMTSDHHPGGDGGTLSVTWTLRNHVDDAVIARVFGVRAVWRSDVKVDRADTPTPRVLKAATHP